MNRQQRRAKKSNKVNKGTSVHFPKGMTKHIHKIWNWDHREVHGDMKVRNF